MGRKAMRKMLLMLCGIVFAALPACARYAPVSPAFQKAIDEPYRLGSGDRVRVTVFGEQQLSNVYAVDKSGYVAIPLVGPVPARGASARQLEAAIAKRLRGGYLRDPDVSVEIDQYRPFYIMGEVNTGGQYTYVPGMTVQNAVAIAGGYTPRAEQKTIDITRNVDGTITTGRVLASDLVLPGDTLYIRERLF